ncbi:DUF3616 domain-containing protein [Streptomyces yatensis]|uniref:DUF3616 domain-containing protein n=2 Tax=Streptomyces yatensis TaxID=155177 RepID=UPI001B3C7D7D|nr:DUF3616 domain-containing protein [Streptomyces yatensis]
MVPFHAAPPRRTRRVVHAAALALVAGATTLSALPASAVAGNADYGTPTIKPATSYLSGAVGATGDPTVTVKVAQSGADADELTVSATATTHGSVARTGDVTVTGTGATREVAVRARGEGYTDLTLKVNGLGGKSATTTLHYAASGAVGNATDTRYLTGSSDSSAAVDVGDGYMVVADDESNVLRLYRRDSSGAPVRTWDVSSGLDVDKEIDIEAAARVGDTVYWTGSLGNNKDGEPKEDRFTLFTTTVSGSGADTELEVGGSYQGLREDLVDWDKANGDRLGFAKGTEDGQVPKQIDGFNVEGLEFAPGSGSTAYLGFRAPLVPPADGGKALLVPVTNADELARSGSDKDTHATFGDPITLDLGGLSVRDIRRNGKGQYLIVAGSWAAEDNSAPYALYSWDGVAGHQPVKRLDLPTADPGGWEIVVDVPDLTAPGARAQVITDSGSADLYGDGTEAKDLEHEEWKKSRSVSFPLNP